jgi:hypothetical protein
VVFIELIWLNAGTDGGALLNTVVNLRDPLYAGKYLCIYTTDDLSKRAQLHGVGYE